jgi:lysophospholipase L1-like esterase
VYDKAVSGTSSKSFYDQGLWANCLKSNADFYFIQFGHNDDKPGDTARYTEPSTTFKGYLSNYVNEARASNGIPVLLTPPTRRNYSSVHVVKLDNLQYYSQAMRELGAVMNVPVLDAYPASIDFYGFVGSNNAPFYQARTNYNDTADQDHTHFNKFGAPQHCYLIMDCLLTATNASLLPLQNAVRKQGVKLHVDLPATRKIQFQGSTNLLNWQNCGSQTSAPPGIDRYFYDVRLGKMFYRAGTN